MIVAYKRYKQDIAFFKTLSINYFNCVTHLYIYYLQSDNIKYYTMSVLQPDDGTDIEDIVFLYRLVPGHALLSYGLHCALLAGVPEEVIKRAASLLNAIGNNNHVDRLCNDKISAQDRQYKDTIDKMLSFDACNGDLNLFFQDIFPS
ncbi:DNA mismatch repair protein MSH5-like isoform X1 [Camellia sinensis]|uniref:DNA mismatch repair protein MSH5-like isoform X1 n=1 Tax=Camellia sinensis TaxID=4442 RepID=UPI00103663D2|nr:DNA mismatch repair protein MSH5-like isoform X1 [Camellia sinensis]XP_028087146.1 DNA mismatch repair protein MSH5-like isoform X1 [Camellia sinensis]XP_028087147.1 DNA mismatch repair protein MSH5-like isoform X1 [Camellia sinensis]XP_028087148.1 DNA mismatch repair protein MSH5-like isoform X1 [Camellia sinensis]XP_028087149.1 DNA mismatch repair protein MSH5-like isoform X1 [Camellia sinensis]XP_028087150.1 DNA mismatch repair protein MSH5-like isoform X1 [Camellia sinensis]